MKKAYIPFAAVVILMVKFGLLATIIANTAHAGVNVWTPLGPEGGEVWSIAINPMNPAIMYASTYFGRVYKSTNSGASWFSSSTSITGWTRDIAVATSDPATVYVGTNSNGVYRSTDAGVTWAAVSATLPDTEITALAIDPHTSSTVYLGTRNGSTGGNTARLYKSTNGGATWTNSSSGIPTGPDGAHALAIDPTSPSTLYAGTYGGGIFKSTNAGSTWTAINTGLLTLVQYASDLAIDPVTPTVLYAATSISGTLKSTNGGATWTTVQPDAYPWAVAIDPQVPPTVYAGADSGLYKSTNGGATWAWISTGAHVLNRGRGLMGKLLDEQS
jgi:photosystem II stability/assembly factor-like uncharacterized protein